MWSTNKEEIKQKLINIFTNKEIINYSEILDRSWFPNIINSNRYNIIEINPAIIEVDKKRLHIQNCGYLKYEKNN